MPIQSCRKTLGEIALRVNDLDAMQEFYANIVGLELMRRFDTSAFFKIADGFAGHTQILALFDRSSPGNYTPPMSASTSVDHLAFSISKSDFDSEFQRLEDLGQNVSTAQHSWVHWKSLYFPDPEGNLVEFVCYDENVVSDK